MYCVSCCLWQVIYGYWCDKLIPLHQLDWIVQCFTSPPTQYRLYGRRFLQVKWPNQQYQNTEGESCKGKQPQKTERKQKLHICIDTQNSRQTAYNYNTASPLVYNYMRWLGDSRVARPERRWGCRRGTPPPLHQAAAPDETVALRTVLIDEC